MRSCLCLAAVVVVAALGTNTADVHAGTLVLEPPQSSGPGFLDIGPFRTDFRGEIHTVFQGVGTFRSTVVVGHDPSTTETHFGFDIAIINLTSIDFADVLFTIDDPEGRGVSVLAGGFEALPFPGFCERSPGVFSPGAVGCLSRIEGLLGLEVPDPGPGRSYTFSLLQTAVPVEPVSEPAAIGLLGLGLAGFAAIRRRKTHRA